MVRPCFLVIDPEFPGSISTRKLVIETAKFNVITAYSGEEALETLRAFPAIAGVVLDVDVRGMSCDTLVKELKGLKHGIPIVAIIGPSDSICEDADVNLESFDPRKLLETLRDLAPEAVKEIELHEEELNRDVK